MLGGQENVHECDFTGYNADTLKYSFRTDESKLSFQCHWVLANTNKNLNITNIYILGQLFDKDRRLIISASDAPYITTLRPGENSAFKRAAHYCNNYEKLHNSLFINVGIIISIFFVNDIIIKM